MTAGNGAPPPPRPELTLRAIAMGLGIGALLAATNVYIGLKVPILDAGAITAVLLSFGLFRLFRSLARTPLTALETNIIQTTAASAAIASYTHGLSGPIAALHLMGMDYPGWLLALFGLAAGAIGIYLAALLRVRLVEEERLPFPSGRATGELIEAIHADRRSASHRTRLLVFAGIAAMIVTWLRDGPWPVVPQVSYLPITIGGLGAAALTVGLSYSPLMAATGVYMGFRASASLLGGGIVGWLVLAPLLHRAHIVEATGFVSAVRWLIWPAVGLLVAGALVSLLLDWRSLGRGLRDLLGAAQRDRGGDASPTGPAGFVARSLTKLALLAAVLVLVLAWRMFSVHPLVVVVTLVISVGVSATCARAAGETDIGPVGSLATLTQMMLGRAPPPGPTIMGALVAGEASQATQSLWSYKAGQRLGASPHAQLAAQLLGLVLGAVVVVPVYFLLLKIYGIGNERLPAPNVLSWKATAEALRTGGLGLPRYALTGAGCGLALGAVLAALARTRLARLLPSATALGIGIITPLSLSAIAFLSAAVVVVIRRARPNIPEASITTLAAGAMAGESFMGVAIAVALALGWL